MSIGRNALLRGAIGIAISVAAVWILIRSVDVGTALQVLGRASPLWIAVMLVTAILDISSRGARWRALLARSRHCRTAASSPTYVGYLANNVLPARLGEAPITVTRWARAGSTGRPLPGPWWSNGSWIP